MKNYESAKTQTFGVEIEMNSKTRRAAAKWGHPCNFCSIFLWGSPCDKKCLSQGGQAGVFLSMVLCSL